MLPNRAYLVSGSNLTELDDLLAEETVIYIHAYVPGMFEQTPANEPKLNITMHWLGDKTPEEFFNEIMAERSQKRMLKPVS